MKTTSAKQYDGLEIAIIGISAQFPGSNDYREFWSNLTAGNESLQFLTDEELKERGVDATLLNDPAFVKTAGGILSDKETFDNAFFGYTAEEATLMDPQIRLFHKHCWNAIDDAGYTAAIDKKKIGLFAGASGNTNWKIHLYGKSAGSNVDPFYLSMISTPNFIGTLVAYKLNLRGPVFYIDSACSTSLGAVHLACRSLLTRECAMALAGGISIQTTRKKGYKYYEGRISSDDGHCRTFDKDATGTAVGEGAGVVVLKRLSEAMKDGDNIYAIIRATAVNNDGAQKVGYTAPSVKGQAECIAAAMKVANVEPASISYVEAHGTATRLGDPVEIRALNEAYALGGKEKSCAIGALKSNIGHLDTAAGIAGLIKTALCLGHRQLVPSLHFKSANPEIDFGSGPFFVNTQLQPWERRNGHPLRAGVSSFGIGGTNAHAILEEAPVREASDAGRKYKLLAVSAKTAGSVERYLTSLHSFLEQHPDTNLADLSYTLQVGRKAFPFRSTLSFTGYEDLLRQLRQPPVVQRGAARNSIPVFLFPGQGSQYMNMALGLYEEEPLFRAQMEEGFALLQQLTGQDMKQVLFHAADGTLVNHTRYTQPLLFLVEYSLSRLLLSLGISPQYMLGHSIGEYVAACLSGVFSFEDALLVVSKRGELMERVSAGVMLSVPVSAAAAATMLTAGISLAAVNGPEQVVFSGDPEAMSGLKARLDAADIAYVQLHTSHAFHSQMQDSILPAFLSVLQQVKLNKPQLPFISNLTGDFIQDTAACSAQYWV
ncbi:type I polyketide synthase, partial [Chitinophaga solisilvae]|uniref:type I polyketide synthase n=1 Tax=Chitinophaga solisilvae TaxID=1233460 RepID=UPI0013712EBA